MNASSQKRAFFGIMGALSSIASYGFLWQSRRYRESTHRWNRIYEEIERFTPYEIRGQSAEFFPWSKDNSSLNDWEYRLVKLKGYFKDERLLVGRLRDNRYGYCVFAPFVTAIENNNVNPNKSNGSIGERGLLVNIGWIPRENKGDEEILRDEKLKMNSSPVQLTEIQGIIRKGESRDSDKDQNQKNMIEEGVYQYIDLPSMAKEIEYFRNNSVSQAYLEKMLGTDDDESDQLYPVAATKDSFFKPYLTPRKHLEYATFWAGATTIGVGSMLIYALR